MEFNFNQQEIEPKKAAELFLNSLSELERKRFKNMLCLSRTPASNIAKYYKVNYKEFMRELEMIL